MKFKLKQRFKLNPKHFLRALCSSLAVVPLALQLALPASAEGVPNIAGITNALSSISASSSCWPNPYNEGFRVYLVDAKTADTSPQVVSEVVDVLRYDSNSDVIHSDSKTKFDYIKNPEFLKIKSAYTPHTYNATNSLPAVLEGNGDSIRTWATNSITLEWFAHKIFCSKFGIEAHPKGATLEACPTCKKLISGDYKLVLEPLMVIRYNDAMYAITGTEYAVINNAGSNKFLIWKDRKNKVFDENPKTALENAKAWYADALKRNANGEWYDEVFDKWESISNGQTLANQGTEFTRVSSDIDNALKSIPTVYYATLSNGFGGTFSQNTYRCLFLNKNGLGLTGYASAPALDLAGVPAAGVAIGCVTFKDNSLTVNAYPYRGTIDPKDSSKITWTNGKKTPLDLSEFVELIQKGKVDYSGKPFIIGNLSKDGSYAEASSNSHKVVFFTLNQGNTTIGKPKSKPSAYFSKYSITTHEVTISKNTDLDKLKKELTDKFGEKAKIYVSYVCTRKGDPIDNTEDNAADNTTPPSAGDGVIDSQHLTQQITITPSLAVQFSTSGTATLPPTQTWYTFSSGTWNGCDRRTCTAPGAHSTHGMTLYPYTKYTRTYSVAYHSEITPTMQTLSMSDIQNNETGTSFISSSAAIYGTPKNPELTLDPGTAAEASAEHTFEGDYTIRFIAHRDFSSAQSIYLADYMSEHNSDYMKYASLNGLAVTSANAPNTPDVADKSSSFTMGLSDFADSTVSRTYDITYKPDRITDNTGVPEKTKNELEASNPADTTNHAATNQSFSQKLETSSSLDVTVSSEKTYAETQTDSLQGDSGIEVTHSKTDNYTKQITITSESPTYTFYPTYRMLYNDKVSESDKPAEKPVWALSTHRIDAQFTNQLTVKFSKVDISMTAPWSRDSEDWNSKYPVLKAGSAYTTETTLKGSIEADVYLLDPKFAADKTQAKKDNTETLSNLAASITDLQNSLGADIGAYSNLYNASTQGSSVTFPNNGKQANQSKEEIKLESGTITFNDPKVTASYLAGSGFIAEAGAIRSTGLEVSDLCDSDSAITTLLGTLPRLEADQDNAVNSDLADLFVESPKGYEWYQEDFQGFIHLKITIGFNANGKNSLLTNYAAVSLEQSDWRTKVNEDAKPIEDSTYSTLAGSTSTKYIVNSKDLSYAVGLELRNVRLGFGNYSTTTFNWLLKPYRFSVRGSVYDTTG